jgi:hypothetical protein
VLERGDEFWTGTNEDVLVVVCAPELALMASPVRFSIAVDYSGSGQGTARAVAWQFIASLFERRPEAIREADRRQRTAVVVGVRSRLRLLEAFLAAQADANADPRTPISGSGDTVTSRSADVAAEGRGNPARRQSPPGRPLDWRQA